MDFKTYYNFLIKIGECFQITEQDIIFYNNLIAQDKAPYKGGLKYLSELNNDEIYLHLVIKKCYLFFHRCMCAHGSRYGHLLQKKKLVTHYFL